MRIAQAHRIKLIAHLTRCLTFPLCPDGAGGEEELASWLGEQSRDH